MKIVQAMNNFLWGWGVSIPILIFGIVASIVLRFPWIRMFKQMNRCLAGKNRADGVSPFKTLCATVGGQVGTGNVVGVATCIATGGPGGLFWMWMTALLGMTTMLVETTLGQLYKERMDDGTYIGGLAYFVSKGMRQKWLGAIAACFVAIGTGMVTVMTSVNGISDSINTVVTIPPVIIGAVLVILAALIIFGGFRRLADFASAVVPFMTIGYILLGLYVVISHFASVPAALGLIVKSAFTPTAVAGGVVGYGIQSAFRYGMARGIFSNEAGQGTTCTISAASDAKHPVTQGLLGSVGVAIDTLFVCTVTGLIILVSGVDYTTLTGAALTQAAFSAFFGNAAGWIIAVALFFFAFTSVLSSLYNGRVNIQFLTKSKPVLYVYMVLQLAMMIVACFFTPTEMFEITDMTSGMMSLVNVIAMIFLFKKVKTCLSDYETQLAAGNKEPEFDWEGFRKENGMAPDGRPL